MGQRSIWSDGCPALGNTLPSHCRQMYRADLSVSSGHLSNGRYCPRQPTKIPRGSYPSKHGHFSLWQRPRDPRHRDACLFRCCSSTLFQLLSFWSWQWRWSQFCNRDRRVEQEHRGVIFVLMTTGRVHVLRTRTCSRHVEWWRTYQMARQSTVVYLCMILSWVYVLDREVASFFL